MSLSCFQIFIPIVATVLNILIQILSFRCIAKLGLLKSEYVGFIAGLFSVFLFEFYTFPEKSILLTNFLAILAVNLIIYASMGFCYFTFINLGETARRVRILRELNNSREGLSMEEILEQYNSKKIIEKRINRLAGNGQIVFQNGKYYISSRIMLLIARAIVIAKLIVLGKKSEFD